MNILFKYKGNIHIFPIIFSLLFSFGYYLDAINATILDTSSDQWNIIPVAMKMDNPDLFLNDLFLNQAEDVNYYTPFFISGLRFFTNLANDNYIAGLNTLNLTINIIFSLSWYFFFFIIFKNVPFALFLSLFVRGIMWLPGYEIWGAGALWTALPRTAFIALLPIGLIFYLPSNRLKHAKKYGAFLLGFTANFHPISGLAILFAIIMTDFTSTYLANRAQWINAIKKSVILASIMLTGLIPFIINYYCNVINNPMEDYDYFRSLLPLRIGDTFTEPLLVLKKFKELNRILFLFLPYIIVILIYKKLPEFHKKIAAFYLTFSFYIMTFSLLIIPIEYLLRRLGIELNMAFQLVRNIKYIVIAVFLFYGFLLFAIISLFKNKQQPAISYLILSFFLILMLISRNDSISRLPFIGDDFIRSTMPNTYSIKKEEYSTQDKDLLKSLNWINENMHDKCLFIGPAQIRTVCRQSIVHDNKGASMLIEGNPERFVLWAERQRELNKCMNQNCKIELYKKWGAEFLLTNTEHSEKQILYNSGKWILYKL